MCSQTRLYYNTGIMLIRISVDQDRLENNLIYKFWRNRQIYLRNIAFVTYKIFSGIISFLQKVTSVKILVAFLVFYKPIEYVLGSMIRHLSLYIFSGTGSTVFLLDSYIWIAVCLLVNKYLNKVTGPIVQFSLFGVLVFVSCIVRSLFLNETGYNRFIDFWTFRAVLFGATGTVLLIMRMAYRKLADYIINLKS